MITTKINKMRATLVTIFTLFYFYGNSQEVVIKTKTYYWGTPEHNFHQQLTENGKQLLNMLFDINPFDSISCTKLKSDDLLEFTSRKYLSEHKYDYISIYKQNEIISIRQYSNDLFSKITDSKKVLLRYSKDIDNQIDRITLHVIH